MIKKWLRISDLDFERDIRSVIAKVIGEHEEVLEKVIPSFMFGVL